MNRITQKTIMLSLLFSISTVFMAHAQVSPEAARLLRSANVQILDRPSSPQDFTLPYLNGRSASLASLRGKVVLLNFWATWCPPCRAEMPSMEVLYQRFKNHGLEIAAVNLREDSDTIRQFMQSQRYSFPVMLDVDGNVGNMYEIIGIPTTYVLDRQGMIIGVVNGSIRWDTPQMTIAIEALLNSR